MGMRRTRTMMARMMREVTILVMGLFGPNFNTLHLMRTGGQSQIQLLHYTLSHNF